MKTGYQRFRKVPRQEPGDKTVFSSTLRQIGECIQGKDFAGGLSRANDVLSDSALPAHARSRVLALVADSEFNRGRFVEAVHIQLQAASANLDHPDLWVRSYIGQVRALLKIPQVDQAVAIARHAVALAEAKMADFDEQVRSAGQAVAENGVVGVPPVPPRVSVVATRMGYLFLQEGEPEVAEEFFQKAIESAKGGANRARQGLAAIALAKGDFEQAIKIASDAIRRGGYKAKTISAWSILIAARRQWGGWRISDRLIKGVDAAPEKLRARTILTIVRELRKNDMRQWREVADHWSKKEGKQYPIIETEIRKLILSSEKAKPAHAAFKWRAAEKLLEMPGLSPKEWLTGAKELVRASLWDGRAIDIDQLVATAAAAYGQNFIPRLQHSLALSCMMAKRHDLARPLLQDNIQQLSSDHPQWGKSVWALARMESLLGDHVTAAGYYRQFAGKKTIAVKFRLQAQLLWCQELFADGRPEALREAREMMTSTLGQIQDPEILMNFGRQLQFGPGDLREWGQQLFEQGKGRALLRFNNATVPSAAIAILFKLARRQVRDFGQCEEVVSFWEGMPESKRDWLWSDSSDFWSYLGEVFEAYVRTGAMQEAEAFAKDFLDDPASPAEGLPSLGILLARRWMMDGRAAEGLELFKRMILVAPTSPRCAEAWYWLALVAYRQGKSSESKKYAMRIRTTLGTQLGMLDEWNLDARACLLLADLEPAAVDPQAVNYTADFLQGQLQIINADLARIPS